MSGKVEKWTPKNCPSGGSATSFLLGRQGRKACVTIPGKKIRAIVRRSLIRKAGEWLQMELPALRGPHASRSWVTVLRAISQGEAL